MKRVSDLRPCDNCHGKIVPQFYLLRVSLALIKPQAVNEFMGMHQFFGGRASAALVENFAPAAADAVIVAGDQEPSLMTEIVICHGVLLQRANRPAALDRTDQRAAEARRGSRGS